MRQSVLTIATKFRRPSLPLADNIVINAIWFDLVWASAVIGGDAWLPVTAGLLILHLFFTSDWVAEVKLWLALATIGVLLDAGLTYAGLFDFGDAYIMSQYSPIPVWLIALWLGFVSTLNRSLRFMARRLWLAALIGFVVPLSYFAGQKLGAVEISLSFWQAYLLLAFLWAITLPLMASLADAVKERASSRKEKPRQEMPSLEKPQQEQRR
ncbi:DUF2878 domain-containing protein [Corallincola platygyrae]|uniref:DUF2878 domain-containing protein n=1 Tax=Corallincola platygyrae TaxID=1193278 RepID=A0ABW4XMV0_9GAMM